MLVLGTAGARWDSSINDNEIDFLIAKFFTYIRRNSTREKYSFNSFHATIGNFNITQPPGLNDDTDLASDICIGFDARPQSAILARRMKILLDITDSWESKSSLINNIPITTPMLCRLCKSRKAFGIMFTASHNPDNYVGVKFITPKGTLIDEKDVLSLNLNTRDYNVKMIDLASIYSSTVLPSYTKDKYSFSTLNGAAKGYINQIFKGQVIEDNTPAKNNSLEPKPDNIILPFETAQTGIAFALDGDGDRLLMFIDGEPLTPSETFLLFIKATSKKMLSKVIATYNMSNIIPKFCNEENINFVWSKIGFQHISPLYINSDDNVVAGEESGGLAFHPFFSDRDGIMAAIILMNFNESRQGGLRSELQNIREKYGRMRYSRFDIHTNMSIEEIKTKFENQVGKLGSPEQDVDGIKCPFMTGWIMFRKSGTEPLIRVYCEIPWNKKFNLEEAFNESY